MDVWGLIKSECAQLKGAPISILILLGVGGYAGYWGGTTLKEQEIKNLKSLVSLKDGELDDYRKKLDERIKKIEDQLTAEQLSSLEQSFSMHPSVVLVGEVPSGNKVGEQLIGALQDSGWRVAYDAAVSGTAGLKVRAMTAEDAEELKKAFEETGIVYTYAGHGEGATFEIPGSVEKKD